MHTENTPYGTYVYCADHHNPDGHGVGRCDYYAQDMADAQNWYDVHYQEEHLEWLPEPVLVGRPIEED